ncbi:uncharacterized protein LOC143916743 [Arctopsyche grandis]|uniref:uncharacterized protein LOC143916743 n=1 Tax=Arctopsyche grandis TaxID=121162 RepID=UPI00406D70B5
MAIYVFIYRLPLLEDDAMSKGVAEDLQDTVLAIQSHPHLKREALLALKNANENLRTRIKTVIEDLRKAKNLKTSLEIEAGREIAKMEEIQNRIAFQRKIFEASTADENIVIELMIEEKAKASTRIDHRDSILSQLGETFRLAPSLYAPDRLKTKVRSLIGKANEVQSELTQIENNLESIKQTLILPNKDNVTFTSVNDIIENSTNIDRMISLSTRNEIDLNDKKTYLVEEINNAKLLRDILTNDVKILNREDMQRLKYNNRLVKK